MGFIPGLFDFTGYTYYVYVLFHSLRPPWTVVLQALLSMEFSRQEYWSWLPF